MIIATPSWAQQNDTEISKHPESILILVQQHEIDGISSLQTPGPVMLVVQYLAQLNLAESKPWYMALDDIQDPGNMGTLIRIADWFGIKHLICSEGCVDAYNPKVVQAAMGSHLRVHTHVQALVTTLPLLDVPVYVTTLQGTNIFQLDRCSTTPGVIVIGNESRGVSEEVLDIASKRITIPRIGGAESLNAGVSAGIICALLLGDTLSQRQ